MVTIQVDDDTFDKLTRRAQSQGQDLADWLRSMAEAEPVTRAGGALDLSQDWTAWRDSIRRRAKDTGHPMDDSRESIYD